jgi:hypothetical protein
MRLRDVGVFPHRWLQVAACCSNKYRNKELSRQSFDASNTAIEHCSVAGAACSGIERFLSKYLRRGSICRLQSLRSMPPEDL